MTLPLIQSAVGTVTSSSSGTATFAQNVNKGSTIIMVEAESNASPQASSASDNQGNTYVGLSGTGGGSKGLRMYLSKNVIGGPIIATSSYSGSTTAVFIAMEFSPFLVGTTSTTILDPNSSSGTTGTATAVTNGSSMTSLLSKDIWFGYACNTGSNTYTLASGWNEVINANNGSSINLGISYKTGNTIGLISGFQTILNQSSTAAYLSELRSLAIQAGFNSNYQFVKVGDGMSASEKIR